MKKEKLLVLWTSKDKEVALNMVFMYTLNSKFREWFKEVKLVIWGPSTALAAEDQDIKDHIEKMKEIGVVIEACKACCENYGVTDNLLELGIDVKYIGVDFTEYLKSDEYTLLSV